MLENTEKIKVLEKHKKAENEKCLCKMKIFSFILKRHSNNFTTSLT